jgi:hypothetical protein
MTSAWPIGLPVASMTVTFMHLGRDDERDQFLQARL